MLTVSNSAAPDEPHAPQIKRDDETRPDVGGAYAGPFNEAEELRLVCEVHGGEGELLVMIDLFNHP